MTEIQEIERSPAFGYWQLELIWNLGFGAWNFVHKVNRGNRLGHSVPKRWRPHGRP